MKSEGFLLEKQKLKAHKRGLVTRRERLDALEELVRPAMLHTGRKSKTAPISQVSRTGKLRVLSVTVVTGGKLV